jgi:hypothetical protein
MDCCSSHVAYGLPGELRGGAVAPAELRSGGVASSVENQVERENLAGSLEDQNHCMKELLQRQG